MTEALLSTPTPQRFPLRSTQLLQTQRVGGVCSLVPDQPSSLDELCYFVGGVAGKQEPVPRLHLVGEPHEREGVTAEGCQDTQERRWLTAATTKGRGADHLSCYSLYTLPQSGDSWAGRPRCWGLCYSWKSVPGNQFWPAFLSPRVVYSPLSQSTAL